MKDDDETPLTASKDVVEHPQLTRDREYAQHLARRHAHEHGKPPPDPVNIKPAVTARLKPRMTHDEIVEALLAAFERNGIKVKNSERWRKTRNT